MPGFLAVHDFGVGDVVVAGLEDGGEGSFAGVEVSFAALDVGEFGLPGFGEPGDTGLCCGPGFVSAHAAGCAVREPGQLVIGLAGCRYGREPAGTASRSITPRRRISTASAGSVLTAALMPISGESTMHPDFRTEIMKARTADAHRRADRDRLARAAGQGRPAQQRDGIRRLLPRLRLRLVLRRLAGDQAVP